MESFPTQLPGFLKLLVRENARIAYPPSMSRGKIASRVVHQGTKAAVGSYFVSSFPIEELWADADGIARHYASWHELQVGPLSQFLHLSKCLSNRKNTTSAVACKFLDTFMLTLMRYPRFQVLRGSLYLPLDRNAFTAIRALSRDYAVFDEVRQLVREKTSYSIEYPEYAACQRALRRFLGVLNRRKEMGFRVEAVADLNSYFWIVNPEKEKN